MPNPYNYTNQEVNALVEEWREDDTIETTLKEFVMWTTRFDAGEFDYWAQTGKVPV